jgi:hypothetical protein
MKLFYVEDTYPGCFYIEIYSPSDMNFSVRIPDNEHYGLLLKEIGGLIPALMIVDSKLKQGISPEQSDIELINKFFSSNKFLQVNPKTIELINSLNEGNFHHTNIELPAAQFDKFLLSRQQSDDPSLVSQKYALLYCNYDPQHGDRDWKSLLDSDLVREIDLLVAQRALVAGEPETTVNEMLYYGSPYAQQMSHPHRGIYATSIVAQAIDCHTAN